jgi:hypothetical protein
MYCPKSDPRLRGKLENLSSPASPGWDVSKNVPEQEFFGAILFIG